MDKKVVSAPPRFKVGDKAWGVSRGELPILEEITIVGIRWIEVDTGMVHVGYMGNLFNFNAVDPRFWDDDELITDKSEAERLCRRTEIDVESIHWQKMIGSRDDQSHCDSELGTCCANISAARDLMLEAKENGAICERDILLIERYITGCAGYEFFKPKPKPYRRELDKFFKMIGIPRNG